MFGDITPACCTPSLQGEHLNRHLDQLHLLPEPFHFILSLSPPGLWNSVKTGNSLTKDIFPSRSHLPVDPGTQELLAESEQLVRQSIPSGLLLPQGAEHWSSSRP